MNEIISFAIKLAFALAAAGCLKQATFYLMKEVARQQQTGLVSLTELTRALEGRPLHRSKHGKHASNHEPVERP